VEDARDAHAQRSVRWWWEDGTMLHLSARLPDDQGAIVVKALERTADRQPPGAEPEGYQARFADALVDLAAAFIASDPDPDRANIIVHVDAEVLDGSADGRRHLENAGALASETVRRLACDSRLQLVLDGRDGKPLGVGRMQRTVSPALARLVRERDKGCRVCGRTYCAQVHHQLPWEEGGATDLDNLLELCPRDHWLVHEGGWRLEGDPYKELRLRRPDGRVLELPWVEPGARERILGLLRPSIAPPDTS
jgi:hypothetical protein